MADVVSLVSSVIPVYGRAAMLRQPVETVIAGDCSSGQTPEAADAKTAAEQVLAR